MPDDNGASWLGRAQLILVLGLMAVAIYFARAPTGIAVDGNEVTGRTAPAPEVSVVLPTPARRGMTVSMTGTITVDAQVGVVPLAAGQVVSVSEALRAGGTFAAGQVLLTIDDERYKLVVERAQAEVDRARARLRDRELEAEEERERYRREHPGGELPARLVEQPKVAKARAQLAAAVIDEKASRITLSDTQLSLPFDGKTISSGVEVGQVVAAVTPVARVYARDALEVTAQIAPDDLKYLQPAVGRTAIVFAEDQMFPAEVVRVGSLVDPRSRFAALYLLFADDIPLESIPVPGTFAVIRIEGPAFDNAFLLPDTAEQRDGDVWVVDNGVLRAVTPRTLGRVAAGLAIRDSVWLVEAFDAGDGVVVEPVFGGHPGMRVNAQVSSAGA